MYPSNIFNESIFAFSKGLWLRSYTNEISFSGSPEFHLHLSNVNINISAGKVINDLLMTLWKTIIKRRVIIENKQRWDIMKDNAIKWNILGYLGPCVHHRNCFCTPGVHIPQMKDKRTRPHNLWKITLIQIKKISRQKTNYFTQDTNVKCISNGRRKINSMTRQLKYHL